MSCADAMAQFAELLLVQRRPSNKSALRLDQSETMRKRSDSETVNGQALWQLAEFDHSCKFHNFLVTPQSVATESGDAKNVAPTGITMDRKGLVTVEVCSALEIDGVEPDVNRDPFNWQTWCDRRGLALRIWTPDQIGATTELRASLDQLYRHVRTCALDRGVERAVMAELSRERSLQFAELKRRLGNDPQLVASSVARLLLEGSIFGNLNVQPRGEFLKYAREQSFIVPSGFRFSEITLLSTINVFT